MSKPDLDNTLNVTIPGNRSLCLPVNPVSLRRAAGLACIVVGLTLLVCDVDAQDILDGAPEINNSSANNLQVELSTNTLSVKAHDVTVIDLLEEIARQSGFITVLHGPLEERISVEFNRLPVYRAMANILSDYNYVMHYVPPSSDKTNRHNNSVSRLWVFSRISEEDYISSAVNPAIEALQQNHLTEDDKLQQNTLQALNSLATGETLTSLNHALTDDDTNKRLTAVFISTDLGADQALPLLTAALNDNKTSVRVEAADALGEIGGKPAVLQLEQALLDPAEEVRKAAIAALAEIGDDNSRQVLLTALRNQDNSMQESLTDALDEIDSEHNLRALQQHLIE